MKRLIELLGIVVCVILLHSCTTSQEITVQGAPGTEIYSPTMDRLGVVDSNGKVSLKISRHVYYSYLMSKNARTNEFVPFALDYKYCNNNLAGAGYHLGLSATLAGALFTGISLAVGDTPELTTVGAAILGTGALTAISSNLYYLKSHGWDMFKYLNKQRTNQDFIFLPIKDTGYNKTLQNDSNKYLETPTSEESSDSSPAVTRRKSSMSRHSLTNNAKLVSGTYSGTGYLAQKDKIIEEYSNVKVVVSRIDNNTVNVDVIENGESYFSTKSKYQVKKKGKNTYVLSLNGIPDAFIKIDNAGHLTYIHPRVNIDGEIYTLNITATKK